MHHLLRLLLDHLEDLGLASVDDRDHRAPEVLSARSTKVDVIAVEREDVALAEHRVVLDERLVCRRDVARKDDKLGLTRAKRLQSLVDTESVNTGLGDEAEVADDRLAGPGKVLSSHRKADQNRSNDHFYNSGEVMSEGTWWNNILSIAP